MLDSAWDSEEQHICKDNNYNNTNKIMYLKNKTTAQTTLNILKPYFSQHFNSFNNSESTIETRGRSVPMFLHCHIVSNLMGWTLATKSPVIRNDSKPSLKTEASGKQVINANQCIYIQPLSTHIYYIAYT